MLAPPAPAVAQPTLAPPSTNTLVLTPAPAPVAIAPIAAAAGTTAELPAFAPTAESTIPQYASQLQPAANAVTASTWDALPSTTGPTSFFSEPPATNPYPFRAATAPAPGTALVPTAPAPTWVGGGYEAPPAPPTNRKAVAGFVLALLGIGLFGLIFSIGGLRKAREHESARLPPVGRVLARWGLALSIIGLVLSVILTSLVITVGTAIFPFLPSSLTSGSLVPSMGGYNQVVYESTLSNDILTETGEAPQAVECPATASVDPGSIIDCTVTLADGGQVIMRTAFMDDGSRTIEQIS